MEPTMALTVFESPPVFVTNILQHDQVGGTQYRRVRPRPDAQAFTTTTYAELNDGPADFVLHSTQPCFCKNILHNPACNRQQTNNTVMHHMHPPLCSSTL